MSSNWLTVSVLAMAHLASVSFSAPHSSPTACALGAASPSSTRSAVTSGAVMLALSAPRKNVSSALVNLRAVAAAARVRGAEQSRRRRTYA